MCLMVLNWRPDHEWPLLLVANRDEFRERPTHPMHWWPGADRDLLAGKDLKAGGTWLAIDQNGRFALLTNIRPGYIGKTGSRSRGELPIRFLNEHLSIEAFHRDVAEYLPEYGGFNLVLGDGERLFWFSSNHPDGQWLDAGIHTLSNDALNTPWPKTRKASRQMAEHTERFEQGLIDDLDILTDRQAADDSQLPDTGVPLEWERQLSAQTITGERYGTRCRTWVRMDRRGFVGVKEIELDASGGIRQDRDFSWNRR
ncbi:NRDE family protein [Saccharospirillum salsuginis]|uniref:NRDE family protein n=1 Tax=Saccharospirillum salsuginis TaxID=418750 RepID=A0A918KJD5_9GAMM|nr:NRDE family protein [Saccharospirillum salsuginis]GGX63169.1 hypothetical protein GCM10007392_33830 [Saccharospirillum salsuginis]